MVLRGEGGKERESLGAGRFSSRAWTSAVPGIESQLDNKNIHGHLEQE